MEMKINSKNRIDDANEKRVELHTHTKMSRYDSVVSAKDLIMTAARWGWDAIAITDHGVTQAFPEAMKTVADNNLNIKVIYGMEGYMTGDDYMQKNAFHVSILVKNVDGLKNLNSLIDFSYRDFFRQNRITKNKLARFRNGLLIGSACKYGELYRAIIEGQSDEKLIEIASFYDYLEVQPIGTCKDLIIRESFPYRKIKTEADLQNVSRKIIELGRKLNKLVVATGDVHFLNPSDIDIRTILHYNLGFRRREDIPLPYFLRTTNEMLNEFDYIDKQTAYDIVVRNSRIVADKIEKISPVPTEGELPILAKTNYAQDLVYDYDIVRLSAIRTIAKVTAEHYVRCYIEEKKLRFSDEKIKHIVEGITGVKVVTAVNEYGFVIIPDSVREFIPLQQIPGSRILVTHYDRGFLSDTIVDHRRENM